MSKLNELAVAVESGNVAEVVTQQAFASPMRDRNCCLIWRN